MDDFLYDKIFGYCLDFNLLYYFYYHGCVPSDLLFLSSSLKACSESVGSSDDVKVRFQLLCSIS